MKTLDPKFAHLRMRELPGLFQYVLFESRESFAEAVAICLKSENALPYSIFSTKDELSMVIPQSLEVKASKVERDWKCFHIVGDMPFGSVQGLIATVSTELKENGIGICAVSSYKTDLFYIKEKSFEATKTALKDIGWEFV